MICFPVWLWIVIGAVWVLSVLAAFLLGHREQERQVLLDLANYGFTTVKGRALRPPPTRLDWREGHQGGITREVTDG